MILIAEHLNLVGDCLVDLVNHENPCQKGSKVIMIMMNYIVGTSQAFSLTVLAVDVRTVEI